MPAVAVFNRLPLGLLSSGFLKSSIGIPHLMAPASGGARRRYGGAMSARRR